MSANQLAEYLLAAPARRQTILRNAKYAPAVLVIRYQAAKDAMKSFLADEVRNKRILSDAIVDLAEVEKTAQTDFRKNDAQLCAEAVKVFQNISDNKILNVLSFREATNLPPLSIGGVNVSVRLDLASYKPHKDGERVGGLIFQTSKAVSAANWRAEHSRNVSTLIWLLVEKHLASLGTPDRQMCLTVDVFGKTVTPAPTSFKRKLNDFEAACGEISALWDRVPPPADFDQ